MHVDTIADLYPDSHVVHIIRDGRDVARSIVGQPWGPTDIPGAARWWKDCVTAAQSGGKGWDGYHEIRYEDLLSDPHRTIEALYGQLHLPLTDEILQQALTATALTVNQDVADPRVAAGKWRSAWRTAERKMFAACAEDLIAQLGYPPTELNREVLAQRARRTKARAHQLRSRRAAKLHAEHGARLNERLQHALATADAFLDALHRRDRQDIETLLAPDATLDVNGAPSSDIVDHLLSDDVPQSKQVHGDVYPSIPHTTAVITYATGRRTYVLTLGEHSILRLAVHH
jgi:hypothetical protein